MGTRAHSERALTGGARRWPGGVAQRGLWLSTVALTLLALGLRASHLGDSLYGDELFLYLDVHGRSLGQVFSVVHDTEKTPPLGFVLGWLLARGGHADVLVRLPSLLAGIATVPLVVALGRRAVGDAGALLGAALIAISPFAMFYGTETRGYALVTAFALASTLCLVNATDGRGRRWWVLYVLAATATVYTHYIGVLVLAPQAAWAAFARRATIRSQLLPHAAVALLFLPWVPSFLVQASHSDKEAAYIASVQGDLLPHTGDIILRALGGFPFASLDHLPGVPALVVLGVLLLVSVGLRIAQRSDVRRRPSALGALVLLLATVPPLALLLYSLRPNTSLLLARNLSVATPYAFIVIAGLVTAVRPRRAALGLSYALLAALAVGMVAAVGASYARPDARDAAAYIDAHVAPDALVFDQVPSDFDDAPAKALRVYLRRPMTVLPTGELGTGWERALRERRPIVVAFRLGRPDGAVPARFETYFGPPGPLRSRFRLVGRHRSDGFQPIIIRSYVPR